MRVEYFYYIKNIITHAQAGYAQGWHAPSGRLCMVAVTEMGLYVPRGALRPRTFMVLQIFYYLLPI